MRRFFLLGVVGSINACVTGLGGRGGGNPPNKNSSGSCQLLHLCVLCSAPPERKICRGEFITTTTSRTQTTCYTTMGCCYSSPHNVRAYRDPGDLDEEIGPLR